MSPATGGLLLEPAYEIVAFRPGIDVDSEDADWPEAVAQHGAEIVDPVAVDIMVRGSRKVASTLKERQVAAKQMIEVLHLDPQEVATRIGTLVANLDPIIGPLGYVVVPRTDASGKRIRPTARFERAGKVAGRNNQGGRA